jgi:hypothetical protein
MLRHHVGQVLVLGTGVSVITAVALMIGPGALASRAAQSPTGNAGQARQLAAATQLFPGQPVPPPAGAPGRPGFPGGPGMMPPPPMGGGAAMTATNQAVYILRGNHLYAYDARNLTLLKDVELPHMPPPPGAPGRPGNPPRPGDGDE